MYRMAARLRRPQTSRKRGWDVDDPARPGNAVPPMPGAQAAGGDASPEEAMLLLLLTHAELALLTVARLDLESVVAAASASRRLRGALASATLGRVLVVCAARAIDSSHDVCRWRDDNPPANWGDVPPAELCRALRTVQRYGNEGVVRRAYVGRLLARLPTPPVCRWSMLDRVAVLCATQRAGRLADADTDPRALHLGMGRDLRMAVWQASRIGGVRWPCAEAALGHARGAPWWPSARQPRANARRNTKERLRQIDYAPVRGAAANLYAYFRAQHDEHRRDDPPPTPPPDDGAPPPPTSTPPHDVPLPAGGRAAKDLSGLCFVVGRPGETIAVPLDGGADTLRVPPLRFKLHDTSHLAGGGCGMLAVTLRGMRSADVTPRDRCRALCCLVDARGNVYITHLFHGGPHGAAVLDFVARFGADPVGVARAIGRVTRACFDCNRPLQTEESLARGFGPVCAVKHARIHRALFGDGGGAGDGGLRVGDAATAIRNAFVPPAGTLQAPAAAWEATRGLRAYIDALLRTPDSAAAAAAPLAQPSVAADSPPRGSSADGPPPKRARCGGPDHGRTM